MVIVGRFFFYDIVVVPDNCMEYTLLKNEKHLFFRFFKIKRNQVVLTKGFPLENSVKIQRIVAIPGDSVSISKSVLYVNNERYKDERGVSYTYSFHTDSIDFAINLLLSHKINFNKEMAVLGKFQFDATVEKLKIIKSVKYFVNVKRKIEDVNVNTAPVLASDNTIYWNKDHLGPVIVPKSGMQIKMDKKAYLLYKEQIERETGKKLSQRAKGYFIEEKPIHLYNFKENYYFLLNDKRSDNYDSRILGFIPENSIVSLHSFKLPWN